MATTEWTFEKAMTRLEKIVSLLESGNCSLDDSLKLFEEGTKLTAYCSKSLKTAEQKIIKLTAADVKENKENAGNGAAESDVSGEK